MACQSTERNRSSGSEPTALRDPDRSVSVIVPVHNDSVNLSACLSSLQACQPAPAEIIVVLDACTDDSAKVAETLSDIRRVETSTRNGPAAARNLGAHISSGEILLFIDADVEVSTDLISRFQSVFHQRPYLGAAFGSYDEYPATTTLVSVFRNLLHHYVHQKSRPNATTFWGGCGAIRKAAFESVGGFCEEYARPSIEDIELGYRLRDSGFEIRLEKSVQVKHLKSWDLGTIARTDIVFRAAPWTSLILSRRRLDNDMNTTLSDRLSVVAVGAAVLSFALTFCFDWAVLAVVGSLALFFGFNFSLYRFLSRAVGMWFAIRAFPLHCFYYLCCGSGLILGIAQWALESRRKSHSSGSIGSELIRKGRRGTAPFARSDDDSPYA